MQQRLDFYKASPDAMKALTALEIASSKLGLEPALLDLIKLRASQINGCAFCVDLHSADMRKRGEPERRVWSVAAWRESPLFSARERAALVWTEAVTLVAQTRVPDAEYEEFRQQFSDVEQVNLTLAIGLINCWNRISVSFRKIPSA